ncbi:hypothetical protein BDP67DRAFT_486147 [Colletotrichum lupini]|nr:hypothetical protein BDP67DRAFT_486147 [Colletotrichum lupini]
MPLDKSAPLRLDDFGQLDAVAIVATMGMLKLEKQRRAFRRCGIRLGDITGAVDSRAGTDARIRHIDAGLAIMATMDGPEVHRPVTFLDALVMKEPSQVDKLQSICLEDRFITRIYHERSVRTITYTSSAPEVNHRTWGLVMSLCYQNGGRSQLRNLCDQYVT